MITSNPKHFAEWFNDKFSNACQKIDADDICVMTECKLIGRYGFYTRQDMETIRAVLQYEQMRQHRPSQQENQSDIPTCKLCGRRLPKNQEGKAGRHKEYCPDCESCRYRERQEKFRHRNRNGIHGNQLTQ
jgi:hypothetical protein